MVRPLLSASLLCVALLTPRLDTLLARQDPTPTESTPEEQPPSTVAEPPAIPPPTFSADTNEVMLYVVVKDRGHFIDDLESSNFQVFDEGRQQELSFFGHEDLPATIGVLVDSSMSMWNNRAKVLDAVHQFILAGNRQDELFGLAFNDEIMPAFAGDDAFTTDPDSLRSALAAAVTARGPTRLFDAVLAGIDQANRGSAVRRALVVVSDGGDTASDATRDETLARTQASNVVVFTVALIDPASPETSSRTLKQMAAATGGEAFEPSTARELSANLQEIAADIRHAYTLAYVPPPTDGAFRKIRVTASAAGRRLTVRTRTGYLSHAPTH